MGIHRDLGLDSVMTKPYGKDEITRIEHFAEELVNEKITGPLYIMGKPYDKNKIRSSVYAMTTEPVAYSLLSLDKLRGKSDMDVEKQKTLFNRIYLSKAVETVTRLFEKPSIATDGFICDLAGISLESLYKCREIGETLEPKDLRCPFLISAVIGFLRRLRPVGFVSVFGLMPKCVGVSTRPE